MHMHTCLQIGVEYIYTCTHNLMCISGNYISYSSRKENYTFLSTEEHFRHVPECVQLTSPKYTGYMQCNCAWLNIHLNSPEGMLHVNVHV